MKINILLLVLLLVVEKVLETVIYAITHGGLKLPEDAALQLFLVILSGLKLDLIYGRAVILTLVFKINLQSRWLKYLCALIMPVSQCILFLIVGLLNGDEARWVFAGAGVGDTFLMSSVAASFVCAPFYGFLVLRSK